MKNILVYILPVLLVLIVSCGKKEDNPVDPPTFGAIEGHISNLGSRSNLSSVNIFTDPPTSFVTSNDSGNYKIFNVEPGQYKITAAKESYDTLTADVTVTVGAASVADFILGVYDSLNNQSFGIIAGTITDSQTDIPLSNAAIKTIPPTGSVTTNVAGTFTIYNVQPGEYIVQANKVGYDSSQITVMVNKGKTVFADISIEVSDTTVIPSAGTISGYIVDSKTGVNISGVQIIVDPPVSSVITNAQGFYSIESVNPGQYTVKASKAGYNETSTQVTVEAGKTTTADLVMFFSTGLISGTVTDNTDGQPVQGVNLKTSPGTSSIITGSDGKFIFDSIEPGSISLTAEKSGYTKATLTLQVTAGNDTKADIVLERN